MNSDGTGLTQLTTTPGQNSAPAWSPLGDKMAFTSTRDGNAEIYLMNVDGSGQIRLTHDPSNEDQPAWAPDAGREESQELLLLDR